TGRRHPAHARRRPAPDRQHGRDRRQASGQRRVDGAGRRESPALRHPNSADRGSRADPPSERHDPTSDHGASRDLRPWLLRLYAHPMPWPSREDDREAISSKPPPETMVRRRRSLVQFRDAFHNFEQLLGNRLIDDFLIHVPNLALQPALVEIAAGPLFVHTTPRWLVFAASPFVSAFAHPKDPSAPFFALSAIASAGLGV